MHNTGNIIFNKNKTKKNGNQKETVNNKITAIMLPKKKKTIPRKEKNYHKVSLKSR